MQTIEVLSTAASHRRLRYLAWLPALVLASAQSYAALSRPSTDWLADLRVYRGAVLELRHHHSLYDFITANDAPFTYPPFAGVIMAPLAYAAERPIGTAWTVATVALVFAMASIVARAADVPARLRPWLAPLTAALLFASSPVSSNLRFGQVSIGLAVLVLVDVLVLDGRRGQGILTGLASAIKLTPLIFIPMLWLGGRRRAAYLGAIAFAAAAGVTWLVLPDDSRRFWGTDLAQVNRLGHISTGGNQSFNGAMLRGHVDDHVRTIVMLVVAAIVGGVALWRARQAYRGGGILTALVIVGAASVVISPISWTHHQIWLVLAALLPVRGGRGWQIAVSTLTVAIMVIPLAAITPIFTNAHLLLAIMIACVIPYRMGRPPSTTPAIVSVDAPTDVVVAG
jgi:alpha-1,2-mannosyltransferase